MEHEKRRFHRWDHDGTELPRPNGFPVPGAFGRFRLILVLRTTNLHSSRTMSATQDGAMHPAESKPKAKGNGQSLIGVRLSDIRLGMIARWERVSPTLIHLHLTFFFSTYISSHPPGKPELYLRRAKTAMVISTRTIFSDKVDKAIDIFEGLTNGWAQGLFVFDNAPSHQSDAPDAISAAGNMVKGALLTIHPPPPCCCRRCCPITRSFVPCRTLTKPTGRQNAVILFLRRHQLTPLTGPKERVDSPL